MYNHEIKNITDNLKGQRSYKEKKTTKSGFESLYAYFEN